MQIPREKNEQAGRLAKATSVKHMVITDQVLSFVQYSPSINKIDVQVIPDRANWMTPIFFCLKNETLPDDHNAFWGLKVQLSRFMLIGDILYKRGFSRPYLRCLVPNEANYVIKEVHKGVCENQFGARLLVHKLIRARYDWPTMQKNTQFYVKACNKC